MAHNNTVLLQILKLVCRHELETLAKSHHQGQKLRKMSRWSQFIAMATAQLSGRTSLRDVILKATWQHNETSTNELNPS